MGSGAKSYMRKGFLIFEEMHKYFHHIWVRRSLVIYDFAPDPYEFPYMWGKLNFLFYQCMYQGFIKWKNESHAIVLLYSFFTCQMLLIFLLKILWLNYVKRTNTTFKLIPQSWNSRCLIENQSAEHLQCASQSNPSEFWCMKDSRQFFDLSIKYSFYWYLEA